MIKVGFKRELDKVKSFPSEVKHTIEGIVEILEENYGCNRNMVEDMGGYVLIVESIDDFKEVKEDLNIDIQQDAVVEYVEIIRSSECRMFTNSLLLCNNDYAISLVIPIEITPENIMNQMEN